MKKRHVLTILVLCLFLMGAYIQTEFYEYFIARTVSTGDDTALDGTTASYTYQFDDKPTTATQLQNGMNAVQIYFYGTDAANEDCDYTIYAYRRGGPAEKVCSGTVTLGTAVEGTTNTFFADTITCTDVWAKDVVVSNSADNCVATLTFDAMGHKWIYVEFADAGETSATMGAYISGF